MYFKSTYSIAIAIMVSCSSLNASSDDISALVEQARELAFSGHYEDAILNYSEAVELHPADDALRMSLATLLRDTGDVDQAALVLKVAVDTGSKDPRVHLLYGELLEATDHNAASRQYRATIDADPASRAAFDALANLEALENEDSGENTNGTKAQISWSETFDQVSVNRLGEQLDGQWCLQLVDIYHREAGMCQHDPLAGDLAVVDDFPRIDLRIDNASKMLISESLADVTEVSLPNRLISSIDVAVGDRYQVHTINFEDGRYLDVNLNDADGQCLQLQQFERGREQLICPNAYTLCRCE